MFGALSAVGDASSAQVQTSISPLHRKLPRFPPTNSMRLVAPIALYPDPLLAQTLAASTYPLEIIQLQQWLDKNKDLKDKALADAVAKQPWDPSIQALAALPDVVKRLADDIQWTTDLGNAFLAQQSDVMDAVQRMRKKAQDKGNLKSTEQQKVETKVIESKSVIVVEQANPQVVYVPSYNPVVVYGPPVYPYPPIYYPPPGYYAAGMAISFGVGVAMGAVWGGGWGWGCGWGGQRYQHQQQQQFQPQHKCVTAGTRVRPSNQPAGGGVATVGGKCRATSNEVAAQSRTSGGAPYRDRATADRFGGTTRGDSLAKRQASARQQVGRQGGNLPATAKAVGTPAGIGRAARVQSEGRGVGNRAGGGGSDRIGSRDLSRSGGGNRDAFGGGSRGYNGSSARSNSSRGASSMGSRGGGEVVASWWWRRAAQINSPGLLREYEEDDVKSISAKEITPGFFGLSSQRRGHVCAGRFLCCATIRTQKTPLLPTRAPQAQGALTLRSRPLMRWSTRPRSSTWLRSVQIFGPDSEDIVFSGEFAQDRQHAADFAAQAHERKASLWIRKAEIAHSFSWATRTGHSRCRW